MANQRPLNLAPFPLFNGRPGLDPDLHVARFLAVCAANKIPEDDYLTTFPISLDGAAFAWYGIQTDLDTWEELREAFVT